MAPKAKDPFMSYWKPLNLQHEHANKYHDLEITHIIAAEAEFAGLFPEAEADTLIWLHRPLVPKLSCTGTYFPNEWKLRFSSAVLRESGFDKFPQLLDSERYQRQTLAALRTAGHERPSGVRYVLDLGPSSDDDLRSEHLEALTLPKGIVQYSVMTDLHNEQRVPVCLAGGHDDACRCFVIENLQKHKKQAGPAEESADAAPVAPVDAALTLPSGKRLVPKTTVSVTSSIWDLALPEAYQLDDYCELRHVANVIRLLLAMAGSPLLLNSAARVYTVAGLAKLWGANGGDSCFQDHLRSWIYDWFFVQHNTVIVDMLPEECFRIAWNIRLPAVVRVAFRILVAERALQDAGSPEGPRTYNRTQKKTVFGRELAGLDDDLETMLDHASEALLHRVDDTWARLHSEEHCFSLLQLPELDRMLTTEHILLEAAAAQPTAQHATEAAKAVHRLAAQFRAIVKSALPLRLTQVPNEEYIDTVQKALQLYVRRQDAGTAKTTTETTTTTTEKTTAASQIRTSFTRTYRSLSDAQKRVTATFWMLMEQQAHHELRCRLNGVTLTALTEQANDALYKAVVMSPTPDANGQTLDQRLRAAGVYKHILGPFHEGDGEVRPYILPFVVDDICDDPQDASRQFFRRWHDRTRFVAEFELNMWQDPSPPLLLSLTQNELRFLPLWAGGDDDGTGAIFQNELPTAQLGPNGPGPAYHTGLTTAGTAMGDGASTATGAPSISEASFVDAEDAKLNADQASDTSGTASFILVPALDGLSLDDSFSSHNSHVVDDGRSTATDGASLSTPSISDVVLVGPSDLEASVKPKAALSVADEPDYEFECDVAFDEDDEDEFDDLMDDNDDDDDDARSDLSDDTVIPEKEGEGTGPNTAHKEEVRKK